MQCLGVRAGIMASHGTHTRVDTRREHRTRAREQGAGRAVGTIRRCLARGPWAAPLNSPQARQREAAKALVAHPTKRARCVC